MSDEMGNLPDFPFCALYFGQIIAPLLVIFVVISVFCANIWL